MGSNIHGYGTSESNHRNRPERKRRNRITDGDGWTGRCDEWNMDNTNTEGEGRTDGEKDV